MRHPPSSPPAAHRLFDPTPAMARRVGSRLGGGLAARWLARPFSGRHAGRLCIYHETDRISFAQIYPFLHYHRDIAAAHDVEIRCMPVARLLEGGPLPAADMALVQVWFTVDGTALDRALERLRAAVPRVSFVDAFAHNDLRLARHVAPHVDFYLKKSLFRDRSLYFRPFQGDTNLTEFYQHRYGLEGAVVDWQVPEGFPERLRLSPNFFTAPRLLRGFERATPPRTEGRAIDVHARLGLGPANGSWYRRMREEGLARIAAIPGIELRSAGKVPPAAFMAELDASKLCFSPFGYGELCWRDVEAILAGAVLIKPDMGHLETLPDLYEAGVTYLPVSWDFADLDAVVQGALDDTALRARIATEAFRRVRNYLQTRAFPGDIAFLFDA